MAAEGQTAASVSVGGGFFGLLTIAFIVLKLTGVIDWSWVWVLAPLWIPWSIFFVIGFVILLIVGVIKLFEGEDKRKRRKLGKALDRYGRSVVR